MTDCPVWLADRLPEAKPYHARLAVAQYARADTIGANDFVLTSAAFKDGGALDPSFTADEEDAVAPPLEWSEPPTGTEDLVLVAEDPVGRGDQAHLHWLAWGFAPQQGKLLEGESPPFAGKNAAGNSEWLLPKLDLGDPAHDYVFQLFAIDRPLGLRPGAGEDEVFAALDGHVLAAAVLSASYEPEALEDLIGETGAEGEDDLDWDAEA